MKREGRDEQAVATELNAYLARESWKLLSAERNDNNEEHSSCAVVKGYFHLEPILEAAVGEISWLCGSMGG
jgi:hypothetical protein